MLWDELTAPEFEKAREKAKDVCIVPFGVIEKHGTHLPLGTDMIIGRRVAEDVAKEEPVVIFPYYYFGQIFEARHVPGTVAVKPELLCSLLDEVCDEIARNGFDKIVLLNSHGGNPQLITYFMQSLLYKKRDYVVYFLSAILTAGETKQLEEIFGKEDDDEHGGRFETSMLMAIRPDLVKMDQVDEAGMKNLHRLDFLEDIYTPIWWYADHPTHFAGDPRTASAEIGGKALKMIADRIVKQIRIIKEDETTRKLQDEFYSKEKHL